MPRTGKFPLALRTASALVVGALTLAVTSACAHATAGTSSAAGGGSTGTSSGTAASSLRLGYFANVTHSTAIAEVANGTLAKDLGSTTLSTTIFNAGPAEMTALLSGQLDAAYVGPSSALSAWTKSDKQGLTIVAGAETGGAELVVDSSITSAAQLKGKTIASPQLGNTQDVALRYWLKQQGYTTNEQGGGDVSIQPEANATTLSLFEQGKIQGAWVPEPWASRLVVEGKGHVLVDEKSLWPAGEFATTNLVVNTAYLKAHPQTVAELLDAQIAVNKWITANPAAAQTLISGAIKKLTGSTIKASEIERAWTEESVTNDPLVSSLQTSLDHAVADGLLKSTSLTGIFDLTLLNQELTKAGETTVSTS
ncbi:ABC transporter substrate-binding protein [Actinospica sp. MGRD01-02]|uniref:ABC transporter substrate-binding protein n=1 Tax=Actinospica acidithermotolerans TaxID=2828514 RepID=A0A941IGE7_9ACTN|nr:ABC transporter substrate-binding protein [Actinospica acidithermotolerans]MBR7826049.1 ABC transporter substrate-binding protein [Actinospica acidithermotolerans]